MCPCQSPDRNRPQRKRFAIDLHRNVDAKMAPLKIKFTHTEVSESSSFVEVSARLSEFSAFVEEMDGGLKVFSICHGFCGAPQLAFYTCFQVTSTSKAIKMDGLRDHTLILNAVLGSLRK